MRNKNTKQSGGFTLVEVIVILVILAILCAILIPSLIGYIDKANEKKVIAETRQCVEAAQTLLSENYGENKTTPPSEAEIKSLAEVKGAISGLEITDASLNHLTYTNDGYAVTYCRDTAACGKHKQIYTTLKDDVASEAESFKAVFDQFPNYNTKMDSVSIATSGSQVAALYNSLPDNVKNCLNDKTWCIFDDSNATPIEGSSGKTRLYFTEKVYGAADNATKVTVYKARLNDDGTVSYQKGTCNVTKGKLNSFGGFTIWDSDRTKL